MCDVCYFIAATTNKHTIDRTNNIFVHTEPVCTPPAPEAHITQCQTGEKALDRFERSNKRQAANYTPVCSGRGLGLPHSRQCSR